MPRVMPSKRPTAAERAFQSGLAQVQEAIGTGRAYIQELTGVEWIVVHYDAGSRKALTFRRHNTTEEKTWIADIRDIYYEAKPCQP